MTVSNRIQSLRRLPRRSRIEALTEALGVASPEESEVLAIELIELAIGPDETRSALRGPLGAAGAPFVWASRRRKSRQAEPARWGLVRNWAVLSQECREAALAIGRGQWGDAIDQLVISEDAGERLAVAEFVSDLGKPEALGALVGLLKDVDSRVAKSAEAGFVKMAGRIAGVRVVGGGLDPNARDLAETGQFVLDETRHAFERELLRAISGVGEHKRRGVLLAALITLGEPRLGVGAEADRPLIAWLENKDDAGHLAMRAVLRRAREPLVRSRAWHWLTRDPIAAAALDRLARAETTEEHEAVLKHGHLVGHPAQRRRLAMVKVRPRVTKREYDGEGSGLELVRWPSAGPVPNIATMRSLSVASRRNLPRWIGSLQMDAASRQRALDPLLSDPDAGVRFAAARAASVRSLVDYCFDRDGRVATTALIRASNVGTELDEDPGIAHQTARRLRRHSSKEVRTIARQECKRTDPWGGSTASRLCARRWLRDDRDGLLAALHERITSGKADQRVRAIMLCRQLGLADTLEAELQMCIMDKGSWTDDDLRIAATAVSALGEAGSSTADRVVRTSLEHSGNRVRANAVEALSSRRHVDLAVGDPGAYAQMIELKSDANHRVRANAIRALLTGTANGQSDRIYEPKAVEGLIAMLSDDRRMHRVAGLWLMDRMLLSGDSTRIGGDLVTIASRVAVLAGDDGDTDVRSRAARCAKSLLRGTQAGWGEKAVDMGMEAVH